MNKIKGEIFFKSLFNTFHMILPEKRDEIQFFVENFLSSGKGLPDYEEKKPKEDSNLENVKTIHVVGSMFKKGDMFSQLSGGCSYEKKAAEVDNAADDPSIFLVIIKLDTNGGTVDGCDLLTNSVLRCRKKKPVYGFVDGSCYSAGMKILFGCTPGKIYASSKDAGVGSLGVLYQHVDLTNFEENKGRIYHTFVVGEHKDDISSRRPVDERMRNEIMRKLNVMYGNLISSVAENTGKSKEFVLEKWAGGRTFLAEEAIKLEIVNGIMDWSDFLSMVSSSNKKLKTSKRKVGMEDLELNAAIVAAKKEGILEGIRQEKDRVSSIGGLLENAPLQERDILGLILDPKIKSAGDAAIALMQEKNQENASALSLFEGESPPPLDQEMKMDVPGETGKNKDEICSKEVFESSHLKEKYINYSTYCETLEMLKDGRAEVF